MRKDHQFVRNLRRRADEVHQPVLLRSGVSENLHFDSCGKGKWGKQGCSVGNEFVSHRFAEVIFFGRLTSGSSGWCFALVLVRVRDKQRLRMDVCAGNEDAEGNGASTEVVLVDGGQSKEATGNEKAPQPNRKRLRFNRRMDLELVRAVIEHGAHIPSYGQAAVRFEAVAKHLSKISDFLESGKDVTWKTTRDRFQLLIKNYQHEDKNSTKYIPCTDEREEELRKALGRVHSQMSEAAPRGKETDDNDTRTNFGGKQKRSREAAVRSADRKGEGQETGVCNDDIRGPDVAKENKSEHSLEAREDPKRTKVTPDGPNGIVSETARDFRECGVQQEGDKKGRSITSRERTADPQWLQIQKERLQVEKELLDLAKKRWESEVERLKLEKERAELERPERSQLTNLLMLLIERLDRGS